jgi:hypothetical protein
VLVGARPPAAPEHGGLPAVVGKGEGITGSSFQSSPGLTRWSGGGSSEGTAQRWSSLVIGMLELDERRAGASAVVSGVVLTLL